MAKRKSTKKLKIVDKSIGTSTELLGIIPESQDAKSIGLDINPNRSSMQTEVRLGNPIILSPSDPTKLILNRIDNDLVSLLPRLDSDQKSKVDTIRSVLKGLIDSL